MTPFNGGTPQTYEAAPTITAARINYATGAVTNQSSPAVVANGISSKVYPGTLLFGSQSFADPIDPSDLNSPLKIGNPWVALDNPQLFDGKWDCISLNEATVVQLLALGLNSSLSFSYAISTPNRDASQPQTTGSNSDNSLQVLAFFPGGVDPSNVNLFEAYFTLSDPAQGLEAFMVIPQVGPIIAASDLIANNSYVAGFPPSIRAAFAVKYYEISKDQSVCSGPLC